MFFSIKKLKSHTKIKSFSQKKIFLALFFSLLLLLTYAAYNYYSFPLGNTNRFWSRGLLVAHAAGEISGSTYTNSADAFDKNYKKGKRWFEMDLMLLADQKIVCCHPGVESNIMVDKISQLTSEQFQQRKWQNKYGLMTFQDLLQKMLQYKDAYIITDSKVINIELIRLLYNEICIVDKSLQSRIIPQFYFPEDLAVLEKFAKENTPFPALIFTLYQNQMNDAEVTSFVQKNNIPIVTISQERFHPNLCSALRTNGTDVFVHTINNPQDILYYLKQNVDGIYTDNYTPNVAYIKAMSSDFHRLRTHKLWSSIIIILSWCFLGSIIFSRFFYVSFFALHHFYFSIAKTACLYAILYPLLSMHIISSEINAYLLLSNCIINFSILSLILVFSHAVSCNKKWLFFTIYNLCMFTWILIYFANYTLLKYFGEGLTDFNVFWTYVNDAITMIDIGGGVVSKKEIFGFIIAPFTFLLLETFFHVKRFVIAQLKPMVAILYVAFTVCVFATSTIFPIANKELYNHVIVNCIQTVYQKKIELTDSLAIRNYITEQHENISFVDDTYPLVKRHNAKEVSSTFRPNMILIIMESVAAKDTSLLAMRQNYIENDFISNVDFPIGISVTPFLQQLCNEGLTYVNYYSNADYTAAARISLLASLYENKRDECIARVYPETKVYGLPEILANVGYESLYFNGAYLEFDNQRGFAKEVGFQKIYGRDELVPKKHTKWAIPDQQLFTTALQKINSAQEPFFATFVTVDNHPPYDALQEEITWDKNHIYNKYLNCVYLTDKNIGLFFKQAKQQKWYENTIFFITSDNGFALMPNNKDFPEQSQNTITKHWVPMIIYTPIPNLQLQGVVTSLGSHIDFSPTILDLLGITTTEHFLGTSLFKNNSKQALLYQWSDSYFWITEDSLYDYNADTLYSFPSLYGMSESRNEIRKKTETFIYSSIFFKKQNRFWNENLRSDITYVKNAASNFFFSATETGKEKYNDSRLREILTGSDVLQKNIAKRFLLKNKMEYMSLFFELLSGNDPELKNFALDNLSEFPLKVVSKKLEIELITESSIILRQKMLDALLEVTNKDCQNTIMRLLEKEKDWQLTIQLINTLEKLKSSSLLVPLANLMVTTENEYVQERILQTLEKIDGDKEILVPQLTTMFTGKDYLNSELTQILAQKTTHRNSFTPTLRQKNFILQDDLRTFVLESSNDNLVNKDWRTIQNVIYLSTYLEATEFNLIFPFLVPALAQINKDHEYPKSTIFLLNLNELFYSSAPKLSENTIYEIAKKIEKNDLQQNKIIFSVLKNCQEKASIAIPFITEKVQTKSTSLLEMFLIGQIFVAMEQKGEKALLSLFNKPQCIFTACYALSLRGIPEALPYLINTIEDATVDNNAKRYALTALGKMGKEAKVAIPSLQKLTTDATLGQLAKETVQKINH